MLKCSDIMYCFDIDGTIINNTNTTNIFKRNIELYSSNVCFKPSDYDIRWSIITGRPKIDLFNIKICCLKNGLAPSEIIFCSNILFVQKDYLKIYNNKLSTFKSILDGDRKVKYTSNKVNRIIHVCNNLSENDYINAHKQRYPIVSVNVIDFKREFFNEIV